jgi:hypothetical protein
MRFRGLMIACALAAASVGVLAPANNARAATLYNL